ncbi:MAG: hypothetical protein J1G38_06540 [Clostridiales bacterium]|nr:hypothetical protein [Clostridiales bacterium]
MIHSMSGGILSDYGTYTFVKVAFEGEPAPRWYISEFDVEEGDKVRAPFGRIDAERVGTVVKVERNVSGQVTPVPLKSAKRLIGKA